MNDKPKLGVVAPLQLKKQESPAEHLRALADRIEAGYYGEVDDSIVILAGERTTADCGNLSICESHFLLTIVTHQILDNALYPELDE